jgi:hypothetical protein
MQASAQQVALAELAQTEEPVARGFSHNAQLVANNITALRKAATELAKSSSVTVEGIDELHHALLPDERHHGLRKVQNWIGETTGTRSTHSSYHRRQNTLRR